MEEFIEVSLIRREKNIGISTWNGWDTLGCNDIRSVIYLKSNTINYDSIEGTKDTCTDCTFSYIPDWEVFEWMDLFDPYRRIYQGCFHYWFCKLLQWEYLPHCRNVPTEVILSFQMCLLPEYSFDDWIKWIFSDYNQFSFHKGDLCESSLWLSDNILWACPYSLVLLRFYLYSALILY